jgi:hypothetical protein
MDIHNEFIAQKKDLVMYKAKPIINRPHRFWGLNRTPWDFTDAEHFSFKIWEEREGGLLMIDWDDTNLTAYLPQIIILNAPASDSDIERGKYYYEIEYMKADGYPILIAFGEMDVL